MLNKIKLICAVILMACLFLPLSTCTKQPHPQDPVQEVVVYERYVVMNDHKTGNASVFERYGVALIFILPLLFSVAALFRTAGGIFYTWIDLCAAMAVIFVVVIHWMTGQLVFGGYLAFFSGAVYMLAAALCFIFSIQHKLKQKEAVFKAKD